MPEIVGAGFGLPTRILDGNRVRDEIKAELKPRIAALAAKGRPPGLAVVLVGNDPASEIYVRNKVKTCGDLGIHSETLRPPESVTTGELLSLIEALNARDDLDGILVQVPLRNAGRPEDPAPPAVIM